MGVFLDKTVNPETKFQGTPDALGRCQPQGTQARIDFLTGAGSFQADGQIPYRTFLLKYLHGKRVCLKQMLGRGVVAFELRRGEEGCKRAK